MRVKVYWFSSGNESTATVVEGSLEEDKVVLRHDHAQEWPATYHRHPKHRTMWTGAYSQAFPCQIKPLLHS